VLDPLLDGLSEFPRQMPGGRRCVDPIYQGTFEGGLEPGGGYVQTVGGIVEEGPLRRGDGRRRRGGRRVSGRVGASGETYGGECRQDDGEGSFTHDRSLTMGM
jgi:hypothetical protein